MSNLVMGIEGLVGSGKTSICRELIRRIPNSVLLNAGNLYRAIVYLLLQNGSTLAGLKRSGKKLDIRQMMEKLRIEIRLENYETVVYSGGKKLPEEALQSKETSLAVSEISNTASNEKAFCVVHDLIEELKKQYHVIFSGRATMKIYPACDYHFFIVADLEERVRRKCLQYRNTERKEEIRRNIVKRDELQKKSGFYEYSPITVEIDVTACQSVEESADKVLQKIKMEERI